VLNKAGTADGELYVDDGETFDYQSGAYIRRAFHFSTATNALVSENLGNRGKLTDKYLKTMKNVSIEKVIVVGAPTSWSSKTGVKVTEGSSSILEAPLEFYAAEGSKAAWAVVKNPKVAIGSD